MVFKVVWTGPARTELREIKNYIAADNRKDNNRAHHFDPHGGCRRTNQAA